MGSGSPAGLTPSKSAPACNADPVRRHMLDLTGFMYELRQRWLYGS